MEHPAGEYKGQPFETNHLAAAAGYYYSGQGETIGFWRNALSAYTLGACSGTPWRIGELMHCVLDAGHPR